MKQKDRKVFIALPCYTGQITTTTFKSLMHDIHQLSLLGVNCQIFDEIAHADIYLLRAQLVAQFLSDKDATDFVMIDSDVGWEPTGLIKLLRHKVDLVAGSYPKRKDPITFMFRSALDEGGTIGGDPDTGLVEVYGMPGGFMRCKRLMIEKMVEHYGPTLTAIDGVVPQKKIVRMFDPYWMDMPDGQRRCLGEDYSFCQRWRDIGGKIYLDASIGMVHVGVKGFFGKLGEFVGPNLTSDPSEGQ